MADVDGSGGLAGDARTVRAALLDAVTLSPSARAVRLAKNAIIDGLAVALAGVDDPAAVASRAGLGELDSGGNSIIWGTPGRGSLGAAAFANSVAEHALGWDDYTQPMYGH